MTLQDLLNARWTALIEALGPSWSPPDISWGYGQSPHFTSARGFATTLVISPTTFYLKFAEKVAHEPTTRVDALVRHELGHVLDFSTDAAVLNGWALGRGVCLPDTPERRADALCEAVWGAPIFYDKDDVQTLTSGQRPRPARLGL